MKIEVWELTYYLINLPMVIGLQQDNHLHRYHNVCKRFHIYFQMVYCDASTNGYLWISQSEADSFRNSLRSEQVRVSFSMLGPVSKKHITFPKKIDFVGWRKNTLYRSSKSLDRSNQVKGIMVSGTYQHLA
jgi:hypothetical protein